jgi:hypothetical protein
MACVPQENSFRIAERLADVALAHLVAEHTDVRF